MSALDKLVKSLHIAVGSVEGAHADVAQAASSAEEAVAAATALGRDDDVTQTTALRDDITGKGGVLTQAKQNLEEVPQRAVALQGGGT